MIQHHDINREIAALRHREAEAWASARSQARMAEADSALEPDRADIRTPRARLALMRRRARSLAIVGPSVGIAIMGLAAVLD
jgi:hypothetical protein